MKKAVSSLVLFTGREMLWGKRKKNPDWKKILMSADHLLDILLQAPW